MLFFMENFHCCPYVVISSLYFLPVQARIYHCHFHPLQAANCCRNSRLVVNEDDLKRVANEKIYGYYCNSSTKIVILKPLGFRKLSNVSDRCEMML